MKASEQLQNFARNVASLPEALDSMADTVESLEQRIQEQHELLAHNRTILQQPGIVRILALAGKLSNQLCISEGALFSQFAYILENYKFEAPEAPEPVDNPYDFDEPETDPEPQNIKVSVLNPLTCELKVGDTVKVVNYLNNETSVKNGDYGVVMKIDNQSQDPYQFFVEKFESYTKDDEYRETTWFMRKNLKLIKRT